DVDVDAAVPGIVRACFANAGQLCVSVERLVVHEAIADEFVAKFVRAVRSLRLGPALDYTADVGSLTSQAQLDKVTAHVDDALARGARVLAGGVHRADVGPYFYAPTVLDDVPAQAEVAREETFGPVVSITRVDCDEDAVTVMNDTEYGLHAAVWSRDTGRARRVAERIECGSVAINDGYTLTWGSVAAPLGGWKASGLGARHGAASIDGLTRQQTVVTSRGSRLGATLDTLYGLGGETPSRVLTTALSAMRRLRVGRVKGLHRYALAHDDAAVRLLEDRELPAGGRQAAREADLHVGLPAQGALLRLDRAARGGHAAEPRRGRRAEPAAQPEPHRHRARDRRLQRAR